MAAETLVGRTPWATGTVLTGALSLTGCPWVYIFQLDAAQRTAGSKAAADFPAPGVGCRLRGGQRAVGPARRGREDPLVLYRPVGGQWQVRGLDPAMPCWKREMAASPFSLITSIPEAMCPRVGQWSWGALLGSSSVPCLHWCFGGCWYPFPVTVLVTCLFRRRAHSWGVLGGYLHSCSLSTVLHLGPLDAEGPCPRRCPGWACVSPPARACGSPGAMVGAGDAAELSAHLPVLVECPGPPSSSFRCFYLNSRGELVPPGLCLPGSRHL